MMLPRSIPSEVLEYLRFQYDKVKDSPTRHANIVLTDDGVRIGSIDIAIKYLKDCRWDIVSRALEIIEVRHGPVKGMPGFFCEAQEHPDANDGLCHCDMSVLMESGCQCGGK